MSELDLIAAFLAGESRYVPPTKAIECEHAQRCGGCPLIGLGYGQQLSSKRNRVVMAAGRFATLELVYTEPVLPAETITEYRSRAKLIAAPGGVLGLYAKGAGHQVVDIPRCRVLSPRLTRVAATLRDRLARDEESGGPLAPWDAARGSGALRAIDLREVHAADGTVQVLLTLVVQRGPSGKEAERREALAAALRHLTSALPEIAGVAVNEQDGDALQVGLGDTTVVSGVAAAHDTIGRARHLATYGSFVQPHRSQAERMHAAIVDVVGGLELQGPAKVLDLYSGPGTLAFALCAVGAHVHAVESFGPLATHTEQAARDARLPLQAETSDVASALRRLLGRGARFDAAVTNPPRRGMSAAAREGLARLEPPVVMYLSCDPDTLARDLDHFARLGYAVTNLRPFDMIPLTDEVETLAVLRRAPVPRPQVAYEDDHIVVVEKAAHEPVTPQSEYVGSLLERVRKLPGCENATALQRLDVGTSGLVVFLKDPETLARWQPAMTQESARRIYVAAVRGVTPSKGTVTRDLRENGTMYSARTRYRRLAVASGHSVLRVIPEQGRPHQIRRHLAAIGHPVLGDDRYGHPPTNRFFEEKNTLDRTFLHCVRVEFDHPVERRRMIIEAPMPGDLRTVLERTSGPGTVRSLEHKNALGQSGASSIPPPPSDSRHHLGSVLDVDVGRPTVRPEMTGGDDDLSRPTMRPEMTGDDDERR